MDIFVARQPIFDRRQKVAAYELLFRAGLTNAFPKDMDGNVASSRVINDTLLVFGFEALTAGKLAYVNVTREVLVNGLYAVLPPRRTVIELLESVTVDEAVLEACRDIKKAGYTLALDDFVYGPEMDQLLPFADVVKIDFLATPAEERKTLPGRLARFGVTLLAEKIETQQIFQEALAEGYAFFQGYFFARPEIVSRQDVPTSKLIYLQFLQELQRPDLNFERLEEVIKRDVSLSVKLLRYLNSAAFGWRSRVTSLKQAIVMLGERPFRQWASLVAIVAIAADRPAELANICLARARFCEALGPFLGLPDRQLDLFLVGLLSSMDALVNRPFSELVGELSLNPDVNDALLGDRERPVGRILGLVLAYEQGNWEEVTKLMATLPVSQEELTRQYLAALEWARVTLPRS